jgi:hypothetical protein
VLVGLSCCLTGSLLLLDWVSFTCNSCRPVVREQISKGTHSTVVGLFCCLTGSLLLLLFITAVPISRGLFGSLLLV